MVGVSSCILLVNRCILKDCNICNKITYFTVLILFVISLLIQLPRRHNKETDKWQFCEHGMFFVGVVKTNVMYETELCGDLEVILAVEKKNINSFSMSNVITAALFFKYSLHQQV